MNKFQERLKELLTENNCKIVDVSRDLNISQNKLSHLKRGRNEPNIDDIIALSKYFDVTTDYLLGATDDY